MNIFERELRKHFPAEFERIDREDRKQKFEAAAARGKAHMDAATAALEAGKPGDALLEIRKDRYGCACYMAKDNKWPIPRAFKDLEKMERLLAEKAAELTEKSSLRVVRAG